MAGEEMKYPSPKETKGKLVDLVQEIWRVRKYLEKVTDMLNHLIEKL